MPEDKLPKLTEAQIRRKASEQSFARGQNYYNDGAIINPSRQGRELRAECQGSDYQPYQLRVTLAARSVADTECDCPYEDGGLCKHLVALLLTYARVPQAFRVLLPLEHLLANQ